MFKIAPFLFKKKTKEFTDNKHLHKWYFYDSLTRKEGNISYSVSHKVRNSAVDALFFGKLIRLLLFAMPFIVVGNVAYS